MCVCAGIRLQNIPESTCARRDAMRPHAQHMHRSCITNVLFCCVKQHVPCLKKMGTRHTDPCHINERMTISEQISGLFQVCPGFVVIKTIIGTMMFNNLDKTHDAPTENFCYFGKVPSYINYHVHKRCNKKSLCNLFNFLMIYWLLFAH
jgi:hypothetical protein